eukprot:1715083-Amphidinium_carterae.1
MSGSPLYFFTSLLSILLACFRWSLLQFSGVVAVWFCSLECRALEEGLAMPPQFSGQTRPLATVLKSTLQTSFMWPRRKVYCPRIDLVWGERAYSLVVARGLPRRAGSSSLLGGLMVAGCRDQPCPATCRVVDQSNAPVCATGVPHQAGCEAELVVTKLCAAAFWGRNGAS